MRSRKGLAVLATAAFLVVSGCSTGSSPSAATSAAPTTGAAVPSSETKQPPYVVGVSNISTANPWRVQMDNEVKYYAEQHPELIKELILVDANDDINKQIADVEDFIAKKVDLIIIAPGTPDGVNAAMEEAVAAGIPVLTWNNSTTSAMVPYQFATPYYDDAVIQAAWLAEQMGGKGNVIALRGIAGASVDTDEYRAFSEMLAKNPDIKVICEEYASWDYGAAKTAVANCLANNPEVNGVMSLSDSMSWAAAEELAAKGYDVSKIPMIGIGGGNGPLKFFMNNPKIPVNIIPDRTDQPIYALEAGFNVLQGKDVGKVYIDPQVITQDNIKDWARSDMPDMVWMGTSLPEDVLKAQAPG